MRVCACVYLNAGRGVGWELRAILPVYQASQPVFSDWAAAGAEVWAELQASPPAAASHLSLVVVVWNPVQAVPVL